MIELRLASVNFKYICSMLRITYDTLKGMNSAVLYEHIVRIG